MMVHNLDGTEQRTCPKCNQVMTFHEGGESTSFDDGDVCYHAERDMWHCESCGLVIDAEEERELELAFAGA
jgi:uncharacterized protein with PIN domain